MSIETFETIRYTADVVVTTTDGYVLLIERGWDPHKGQWALTGVRAGSDEARETEDPVHLVRVFGISVTTAMKYIHTAHPHRGGPIPR